MKRLLLCINKLPLKPSLIPIVTRQHLVMESNCLRKDIVMLMGAENGFLA